MAFVKLPSKADVEKWDRMSDEIHMLEDYLTDVGHGFDNPIVYEGCELFAGKTNNGVRIVYGEMPLHQVKVYKRFDIWNFLKFELGNPNANSWFNPKEIFG